MSKLMLGVAAVALAFALPAIAQAPQADPDLNRLPAGPERQVVADACTVCHTLERIVTASHDKFEWDRLVDGMVNVGAPLTPDQIPQVESLPAEDRAPNPSRRSEVVPGSVKVEIKEWNTPTHGTRPHDPLATPDGMLWYTGHRASVLGRVDPKTGEVTEFKTKTPMSGPHGLADDKDGNIWYTGNFKSYIGKLDPKTGQFTEYKMPDPKARDPHTLIFDKSGMLWFTVQGGNMVGRSRTRPTARSS